MINKGRRRGNIYMGRGYDKRHEAEQKQVEIIEDRRDKPPGIRRLTRQLETLMTHWFVALRIRLRIVLADDKTLDIAGIGDVILKTSFGTSWTLKDVRYIPRLKRRLISVGQLDEEGYHVVFRDHHCKVLLRRLGIGMSMLASKGNVPDVRKDPATMILLSKTAVGVAIVMLKMVPETPLQFGVAERLSRTFRADSTGLHVEAPKIGGMTREGYKSHTLEVAQMKWDTAFRTRRVTRLSEAEMSHLRTQFMEPENDSIVAEHGLSSEITQSPGGSSDTRWRLQGSIEALSSKEFIQWKEAINKEMVSLEKNQTCSLIRLLAGKKASQRLWMFKVKEEQNSSEKGPYYVGNLNNTSIEHKRRGFSASWVERKPRVQTEGNSIRIKASTKTMVRCSKKQVLGYVLTVGITTVEWESGLQKSITIYTKISIHLAKNLKVCSWAKLVRILIREGSLSFVEDSWNEEPCNDVYQVGDEIEVKVLRSFNWPLSELIMEDGVLPERVQRIPDVWRYRKVRAVALLKGRWFEVYRDYLRRRSMK
ncbi:retrovirus-related pol polyprotein from transposon TNT 1-94 [Tanacetum coccineum]